MHMLGIDNINIGVFPLHYVHQLPMELDSAIEIHNIYLPYNVLSQLPMGN